MKRKICALFIVFLFLAFDAFTAPNVSGSEQPWRTLERAHIVFRSGNFGEAIGLAELAKQLRAKEYSGYLETIAAAMKSWQMQQVGDNITSVLTALRERGSYDAVKVLTSFIDLHDVDFFHDSVAEITAHIKKMMVYPEAELLIGDVYAVEGETMLAKLYYFKAAEQAYALDIPDTKYNIFYKIARLAHSIDDDELFEQSIKSVLADDRYYYDNFNLSAAHDERENSHAMIKSILTAIDNGQVADRLFLMYRTNEYRSLEAYSEFAAFLHNHEKVGDDRFLIVSLLGALTSFTRMEEIISERTVGYSYTGLDAFFKQAARYRDLQSWVEEHAVWQSFFFFAEAVQSRGNTLLASELFGVIANNSSNAYLAKSAAQKLAAIAQNQ